MKTKFLLLFTLSALIFASCSKDDETDTIWKESNEAAFAKTAASSEFKTIESPSKNGSIAYRVIKSGDGKRPLYNDKVKVLYEGSYKRYDWNKEDSYKNEDGVTIKNRIIFDSTADRNNVAQSFVVSTLVDGFSTALQNMNVGDKWEVWMPWRLAYGANGSQIIPAYTTLVFEIELVEIIKE